LIFLLASTVVMVSVSILSLCWDFVASDGYVVLTTTHEI